MDSSDSDSDRELLAAIINWDEEEMENNTFPIQKTYKTRINYLDTLDEGEFQYRFRLTKAIVAEILEEISPNLKTTSKRNKGILPLHQLLLTLRFYALGTTLVSVADFVGVSKTSAGRIVKDVSRCLAQLYQNNIYMLPNTQEDFYEISRFPRVLGALDCTHVAIDSPNSNVGEEFRNRKGYFSLNVQAVCDANLLLMNVVARWAGSAHDATIFNNSDLKVQCEAGVFGNKWLLGDGGYPCKSYLLTPLSNPATQAQQNYNKAHIRARNTIERCFGVWKRRFPIIGLKARIAVDTTQSIIIATAVLHNKCRRLNLEEVEPEVAIPAYQEIEIEQNGAQAEAAVRTELIENYFS